MFISIETSLPWLSIGIVGIHFARKANSYLQRHNKNETDSGEDADDNFEVTVKANSALVCEDKAKTSKVHTKDEEIVDLTSDNAGSTTRQSSPDSFIKSKPKEAGTADAKIDELIKKVDEVLTLVSAGGY